MKKRGRRKLHAASWALSSTLLTLAVVFAVHAATSTELPKEGEAPKLYSAQGGDDLTLTFRTAISQAKKSVLMVIYHLNDPAIIRSLKNKAAEGVEVTVLYDSKASPGLAKQLGSKVKTVPHTGSGLMHQKILVIDKQQVLAGSANMTPYSLRLHDNLVAGVNDSGLASYIVEGVLGERRETGGKLFEAGGQRLEFWMLPAGAQAAERIIQLIDSAEKSVRVAMFTWTRDDFAQALVRAKLRGVETSVALDRNSSKGASAKVAKLLAEQGIPLFLSSGDNLLHHKFLYIDSRTLVNGSANWTKAAFTQNCDCFMVMDELTPSQQDKVEKVWQGLVRKADKYTSP